MSDGKVWELTHAVQPGLAIVERYFNTLDLVPASIIRETRNAVAVALACLRQRNLFSLRRFYDDRVQILFVARRIRMVEKSIRKLSVLFCHEARQDSVVPDVIIGVVFFVTNPYFLQPLDTAPANISRDNQTHWIAMIRREWHVVHFVCQNYIVGRVHGMLERNACCVLPVARLVGSLKVDPMPLPITSGHGLWDACR